ncbi:GNAT family N-acetyltransferase [Psychroserpens sp. MEBiC05023]
MLFILKALLHRIKIAFILIGNGNLKPLLEGLYTRVYSTVNFVGLEVTQNNLKNSDSKLDIIIRPFESSDINSLKEELRHRRLVSENIPDCYIAITKNNEAVYRQWLFKSSENEQVRDYFGPIFPELKSNEAIIEGVFTHPDYRGLRIMPNAIYKTLTQDHYKHITRAIAFVEEKNSASLKGFYRIGFEPYIVRREKWFLFKRNVSFIPLPSEIEQTI